MVRLLGYEWFKLWKKRIFLVMAALLLVGNLVTLYAFERYESRFFYIYQQKAQYERFLAGDSSVDTDGYYQWSLDEQQSYLESYDVFIEQMGARVEQMSSLSLYSDKNSYVYRNLVQTQNDFSKFQGLELKIDNCFGVQAFAGYNAGILFLIVFLLLLTYFVIFYERDKNLLLLLKGNREGHFPLGTAKLLVMCLCTIFYTILQEVSTMFLLGNLYGYGNLHRALQSISLFRNCALALTLEQGLLLLVLIRICVALMLVFFLFCVGMAIKSEGLAVLVTGAALGVEWLLCQTLQSSGSFRCLKCINLFYWWNMKQSLGEYLNFNLFRMPVGKVQCTWAVALVLAAGWIGAGLIVFHKMCQIKTTGWLERLLQWLRKKTGWLNRRTSLMHYEWVKMLIQQKKGIVLLLLILWCVYEGMGVYSVDYYTNADEAAYQYYIQQLQGKVTEQTFAYMEQEEARLQDLWAQIEELSMDESESSQFKMQMVQNELKQYENGFYQVQMQLELLSQKDGDIMEKYLVNEKKYGEIWWDVAHNVGLWFVGAVAVLYFVCGIYPADEKRGMLSLLRSTKRGRTALDRSKDWCALLCTGLVYVLAELPLFLEYRKIDAFSSAAQRLSDWTNFTVETGMTLGALVAADFFLKAVSFLAVGVVGLKLSQAIKNELIAVLAGTGAAALLALIFYHFGWDISILILGLG